MDKELWDRCQMLVDAGMGHIVKHLYVEEIETNLTAEQLAKLGDISSMLDRTMTAKQNMKQLIDAIIELSKRGVILGPR